AAFAVLIAVFRIAVSLSIVGLTLGANLPYAFGSFTLLLVPLWFFGFGAGEWIRSTIRARLLRVMLAGLLSIPYFVFAFPTHNVHLRSLFLVIALPIVLSAALEFSPLPPSFNWQDIVVLGVLVATYMLRLLAGAWPYAG